MDVETAGDDDLAGPADQRDVAAFVCPPEIASPAPAAAEVAGRFFLVPEVALHHVGPAGHQLADRPGRDRVAVRVDDPEFHSFRRLADGAGVRFGVPRLEDRERAGFGLAVVVGVTAVWQRVPALLDEAGRRRCAPDADVLQ